MNIKTVVKINEEGLSELKDAQDLIIYEPTELQNKEEVVLKPKVQRFLHLYLTGGYTADNISKVLNVSLATVRKWLKNPEIKEKITKFQKQDDEIINESLKALRTKALAKLTALIDSPIDGIALAAVDRVLDRTGHKAVQKKEIDVNVKTFEQKILEMANVIEVELLEGEDEDE